jgi:REP element-mobilizing transposase RayT
MPRKARIDAPGAVQHIIIRGIERKKIFRNDADRKNFTSRLSTIVSQTQTTCYAWALIPNHVHLLLRTGDTPIATVMRRLLTGYAVSFNLKYKRHGQLFQNRYKSILCQEDRYLRQLVRYIHLNPLRANLISDLKALDRYRWCGHSAIMGKTHCDWQNTDYVLKLFGNKISSARRNYRSFVFKGIAEGRRPDLTGGGLIRSLGGWHQVKALRRSGIRFKCDERILGDSEFVEQVLKEAEDRLERRYALEAKGYDFEQVVERVAQVMNMNASDVLKRSKNAQTVKARSLLCFWANRELGMTTVEISHRLKLSQSAVSRSSMRGERLALRKGFHILESH